MIKKPREAYEIKLPDNLKKLLEKYMMLQRVKNLCDEHIKNAYDEYAEICNNAESVIEASWLDPKMAIVPLSIMKDEALMKASRHESTIHRFAPDWESPMREFVKEIENVIKDFEEIGRIELENLKKSENN